MADLDEFLLSVHELFLLLLQLLLVSKQLGLKSLVLYVGFAGFLFACLVALRFIGRGLLLLLECG